jgi:hypothetical protein
VGLESVAKSADVRVLADYMQQQLGSIDLWYVRGVVWGLLPVGVAVPALLPYRLSCQPTLSNIQQLLPCLM